jgi:glucose/arabinose dehydrogenase
MTIRILCCLFALIAVACSGDDAPRGADPVPSESRLAPTTPSRPDGAKGDAAFRPERVRVALEPFVGGFAAPLLLTTAGDGSERMFVVEQGGTIRVLDDQEVLERPFLDISDLTEAGGEQGLLGLAFHPAYPDDRRFFINYTDQAGDTVIASYETASSTSADEDSGQILLKIDQPYANHNGGHLAFGPDGFLYIASGDGGSAGDPEENGQNPDALLGKLLRIDVDGGEPYAAPADNPYADGDGGAPEVWALGLRNPWRFSFDEATDSLWVADVGQDELEEVNRVPLDEPGVNYGWNAMEGSACYEPSDCDRSGLTLPITEYGHEEGCSVTGGFVYRGERFPDWRGGYFFADFCSGSVWVVDARARSAVEPTLVASSEHSISSFGMDAAGELYVTDLASGEILRLTEPS